MINHILWRSLLDWCIYPMPFLSPECSIVISHLFPAFSITFNYHSCILCSVLSQCIFIFYSLQCCRCPVPQGVGRSPCGGREILFVFISAGATRGWGGVCVCVSACMQLCVCVCVCVPACLHAGDNANQSQSKTAVPSLWPNDHFSSRDLSPPRSCSCTRSQNCTGKNHIPL